MARCDRAGRSAGWSAGDGYGWMPRPRRSAPVLQLDGVETRGLLDEPPELSEKRRVREHRLHRRLRRQQHGRREHKLLAPPSADRLVLPLIDEARQLPNEELHRLRLREDGLCALVGLKLAAQRVNLRLKVLCATVAMCAQSIRRLSFGVPQRSEQGTTTQSWARRANRRYRMRDIRTRSGSCPPPHSGQWAKVVSEACAHPSVQRSHPPLAAHPQSRRAP
eukprot:6400368-Prymnesium_polylepis.2